MNQFVINPLNKEELLAFLDDKAKGIIKYFIVKSLFSQPEPKIGQRLLPIQIPKEHIEQWFTQALDVKPVGAGSFPVDIYNEREHWGADIKMLNIKVDPLGNVVNGDSGEASLGQNFSDDDINLDTLFHSRNFDEIKDKWIMLFGLKYEAMKLHYPLVEKIFYFFILRPGVQDIGTDFYFTGAVLDFNKLPSVIVDQERTTLKSVFLKNFIAPGYGNTKIYKSKKRLELRINAKNWIENDLSVRIKTSFNSQNIDLRNEEINSEFLEKQFARLKDIDIEFIS